MHPSVTLIFVALGLVGSSGARATQTVPVSHVNIVQVDNNLGFETLSDQDFHDGGFPYFRLCM